MKTTVIQTCCALALMWLAGCNGDQEECAYQPDVSAVAVELEFESLEDSLVNVPSKQALVSFLTRHPVIRDVVLQRPAYPDDSVFINELYNRYNNPHLDTLMRETRERFGDYQHLKGQFTEAFRHLKHYYPEVKMPRVQTVVTGFLGSDLFLSDSLLIISVDFFLGPGATYRPNTYDYILRQYQPENIVPSCMLLYGISDRFNASDMSDRTVLADMIAYGKSFYFAKRMLPCTPDSTFLWYTPKEIRQSRKNQDLIWARLVQDEVLYETSHQVKQRYLGERPKTIEVGPECPGRIGQFVGWEIVNSYMKSHPNESLQELMRRDNARKILETSGYTKNIPRR